MDDKDSDIAKLKQEFLQALHKKNMEIQSLQFDILEKTGEINKLLIENQGLKTLNDMFNGFVKSRESTLQMSFSGYGDLWKSHQSFADKAVVAIDNLSIDVLDKSERIEKYRTGPKKKSSDSEQKWALAKQYFAEEIQSMEP